MSTVIINKHPTPLPCGSCKVMRKKIIKRRRSDITGDIIKCPITFSFVCTTKGCSLALNMHKVNTWVLSKKQDAYI